MIERNNERMVGNRKAYYDLNRDKILAKKAIRFANSAMAVKPGERFYKLVVVRQVDSYRSRSLKTGHLSCRKMWLVRCDCGNEFESEGTKLRRGLIVMCRKCASSLRPQSQLRLSGVEKVFNRVIGMRAKKKGIFVDLSLDAFEKLVVGDCRYCGARPMRRDYLGKKDLSVEINGVDRVDSNKGYVEGNVVSCCSRCNQAKNNMTLDDFLAWVEKVYRHSVESRCSGKAAVRKS